MISKTIGSATAGNNTGSATADYTSIDAAISASIWDTDDVTLTAITKVAALQTTTATLNPANTGSWKYLLTADSSTYINSPTTSAATSRARITATVNISGVGWTWEKVSVIAGSANGMVLTESSTVQRIYLSSTGTYACRTIGTGKIYTITNLAIVSGATVGISLDSGTSTTNVYQTSLLDTSGAFGNYYAESNQTINTYGCICQGSGTNWRGGGTRGGDYNVSQDTTAPGANSLLSKSGVFSNTTPTFEDLSLSGSVSVNIVDRTGFPSDTGTDIVGTTRPSTGADAGVWQTPSITPSPNPIDDINFSRRGKGRTLPVPSAIGR